MLKIETDKERPVKSFERKLKISTVNVRSIQNKHLLFLDHLISNKIDICVVTEVWLNNLNPIVIADLNDQGYVFKPTVRQQRGGGIAISSRKNINITEVDKSGDKSTFEFVKWQVITDHHSFCLFGIYHPPPSEQHQFTNQQFIDELAETLVPVLAKSKNILVMGDLNINVNNLEDPDNILLQNWLKAFGMVNHVTFPTHTQVETHWI